MLPLLSSVPIVLQVLYSLVNVSIRHQDYESAVKCLELLQHVELPALLASLHAAQGRLYLQLGNLALADQAFSQAARARDDSIDSQVKARRSRQERLKPTGFAG